MSLSIEEKNEIVKLLKEHIEKNKIKRLTEIIKILESICLSPLIILPFVLIVNFVIYIFTIDLILIILSKLYTVSCWVYCIIWVCSCIIWVCSCIVRIYHFDLPADQETKKMEVKDKYDNWSI